MTRIDGRKVDELRTVKITPHFLANPSGSCFIEMGNTKVICSVFMEDTVPPFLKNSGKGWLTAEYSMLPGSSAQRVSRERAKIGGRTHEIQRLIGRSLRMCLDMPKMGERTILIDCDVVEADGGTRTASITGSYIALALALRKFEKKVPGISSCLKTAVAAVSVGVVQGRALLDLNYEEDKSAEVDMNLVKTASGLFVEVQGTAENNPYSQELLQSMLDVGAIGIERLLQLQREIING